MKVWLPFTIQLAMAVVVVVIFHSQSRTWLTIATVAYCAILSLQLYRFHRYFEEVRKTIQCAEDQTMTQLAQQSPSTRSPNQQT